MQETVLDVQFGAVGVGVRNRLGFLVGRGDLLGATLGLTTGGLTGTSATSPALVSFIFFKNRSNQCGIWIFSIFFRKPFNSTCSF